MKKIEGRYPLADAQDTISQFMDGTPKWYEEFPVEARDKACVSCGIFPDKMKELADALETFFSY